MPDSTGSVCQDHSGVCKEIVHILESDRDQWKEINGMKRLLIIVLTSTVITMLGVILNLVVVLAKTS